MITKTKLANLLEISLDKVEQVDSKQLFVVSHTGYKLYFSYDTCIGIKMDDEALYITEQFYSVTTSKHKNILKKKFKRFRSFIELPVHVFDDLYDSLAIHG